ncbi:FAD-dependent oxidoreductase [Gemmobacter aquarius]|uniref:Pyridine nucleotide-disulfide oxidoreductase domain-containing protein 2 n=1 Tax=Paragemmobacter aquarius TaxID=2169400 RepID=A0A2S0UKH4_9RHOB|nr:NAD(P)/FAD-dependent oxidoreductase [Gemmobacter aquarius]AWB48324.1 FAD-dependent oxidoreductase [Gemmobacter aquarius]
MQSPDHIIIGSGINALVAGALLSLKGKRVLMLERSDVAGGCLRTEEITLPGFHHDVMAATWVLFMTSPAGAALSPHLAKHGFDYCHTVHPTAVLRPDGSSLVLTTDRAKNVATFDALATGDGTQHAADVGGIEADAPFLFSLLGGDLWSWPTLKLLIGQARKRGPRGLAAWFGTALTPARGWLESGYQSPLVQALFAPWVLHCGLTPESTYSGKMGQVVAFALEAAGAPVVKGGSGQAVKAFCALIEANGGALRTNADVAEILTANDRTTGVRLATGETIACASVLASVTPSQLTTRLLPNAVPATQAAAKSFRHGRGNFQLHYALDRPPEWLAKGLDDVALIHLTDGIDAVSKSANEAERGLLPATPTICVGQPHRLDPTRCPDGKAILWLQIPDAPRHVKGDAAGEIATNGWDEATREAFADRIEAILSRHIKDFAAIKLARTAHSPADLNALNINLVGGDPYGGLCSIDQFFLFRPFAAAPDLPKGLTLIGASTHPGPGLGGGSGFIAANRLAKRGRA